MCIIDLNSAWFESDTLIVQNSFSYNIMLSRTFGYSSCIFTAGKYSIIEYEGHPIVKI